MNKTTISVVIAMGIALLLPITKVQAQEIQTYAGIGLGSFTFNSEIFGASSSGSTFGGYGILGADINENLGLEIRLGATGDAPVWGINYTMNSFSTLAVKGKLPIAESSSVYGLLGGTSSNLTTSAGADITKFSTSFGLGFQANIGDNLSFGAEWIRYWHNVAAATGVTIDVDGISATLDYKF